MGREVRRVPPDWQHPKDENGNYIPLFGGDFTKRDSEWLSEAEQWSKGLRRDYKSDWIQIEEIYKALSYEEWTGNRPLVDDYMSQCGTHYMMYETTSEGTPISPAFGTPEELAHWLTETGASAFASQTATYEQWLRVCQGGYAPTCVVRHGRIVSGVTGL